MDVRRWPAKVERSLMEKKVVSAQGGMETSHEISYTIHWSMTRRKIKKIIKMCPNHLPSSGLQHTVHKLLNTSPA